MWGIGSASTEAQAAHGAFAQAAATSEWSKASAAMTRLLLLTNGNLDSSTRRVLLHVPGDVLPAWPGLAMALATTGGHAEARPNEVQRYLRAAAYPALSESDLPQNDVFALRSLSSWACRRLGDVAGAVIAADSGLMLLSRMDATRSADLGSFRTMGLLQFSSSYLDYGATHEAQRLIDDALSAARTREAYSEAQSVRSAFESVIAGRLAPDSSDRQAPVWESESRDGSTQSALRRAIARAYAHVDAHRFKAAMAEISPWEAAARCSEYRPYVEWVHLHCAYAAGCEGEYIDSLARADSLELPAGSQLSFGRAALQGAVQVVRALSASKGPSFATAERFAGQFAAAQMVRLIVRGDRLTAAMSAPVLSQIPGHSPRTRASVLVLGAAAALELGDRSLAEEHLRRLFADPSIRGGRFHSLYLPATSSLAIRAFAAEVGDPRLESLLQSDVELQPSSKRSMPGPLLSARERAVLTACSTRGSRQQVAAALGVSENTVKAHLRTAYRKLGVGTLNEAVDRASRLGLLP